MATKKREEKAAAAAGKGFLRDPCRYSTRFRLYFTESILGTSPNNPDIYRDYLGKKAIAEGAKMSEETAARIAARVDEEVEALVESDLTKGKTVFARDENGDPILYDYQVRGFFKSAAQAMKKASGSLSSGVRAYKKLVDTGVFIEERKIPIHTDGIMGECQRPLRASGPQGERVSISISEEIPAGAWIEFTVKVFNESDLDLVREWMAFGRYNGIGQWRNGGHGRFEWEELDTEGNIIDGNREAA